MASRPNPDGWSGGSEEFDTQWQSHGHRIFSNTLNYGEGLTEDSDGSVHNAEMGYTEDHDYPNCL